MVRTKRGLTERHQKILDFVSAYVEKHSYPPSIREIGEATGISSTSVVTYYLKQLTEMGKIERDEKNSRALRRITAWAYHPARTGSMLDWFGTLCGLARFGKKRSRTSPADDRGRSLLPR